MVKFKGKVFWVFCVIVFSKYVAPSHICSGVFYGFCIISFSKLVNVTWHDKRPFNQRFGLLSLPGDFNFWDLVNAASSASTVMFYHSCSFTFSFPFSIFPIQLADIFQAFVSPHIPFQNFYVVPLGRFFYHNLVFPNFSIEFFGVCLEDLILPVAFVRFIKSPFSLCFWLHCLL